MTQPSDPARTRVRGTKFREESRQEVLAIDPSQLDKVWLPRRSLGAQLVVPPGMADFSYLYTDVLPNDRTEDGVAIVTVQGPLEHHEQACWDSYEAIIQRVEDALTGDDVKKAHFAQNYWRDPEGYEPCEGLPAKAVVLRIDSPGGEAAGAMWVHRKIRSLCESYGVPIYAYADEMAASAAYALASSADEIWLPDTGQVGSVGVIATLFDRTRQNKRAGLHVELITSGAYKADNHADRVIDDGIRARMQAKVDALAVIFWKLVAAARTRSLGEEVTPESVAALEAGVYVGRDAVAIGLADGCASWGAFMRMVSQSVALSDQQSVA